MQESEIKEPKEIRVNTITAISTAVLAFIGTIGLILALTEFITRNKILGITGSTLIIVTITIGLIVTILILKRWIKNG